jgi:nucleoside-diphosphate-sugar epimerase
MSSETPVLAETSYGCQKQIIELYVYDYGRKGFLETRSVRLPTVAIRSGAVRLLYPRITELMEAIICSIIIHLWSN